jgi:hypothetical protein
MFRLMIRFTFVLVIRFTFMLLIHDSLYGGLLDVSWITLRFTCGTHSEYAKVKTQLIPCHRPLVLGIMKLCPTLFEGQDNLCLQLHYLMHNLRPYFLGWVLDFCSLKADFSLLNMYFRIKDLLVPILELVVP